MIDERSSSYCYLLASSRNRSGLLLGPFEQEEISGIRKHVDPLYICSDTETVMHGSDGAYRIPFREAKPKTWGVIIAKVTVGGGRENEVLARIDELVAGRQSALVLKILSTAHFMRTSVLLNQWRAKWDADVYLPLPSSKRLKILVPLRKGASAAGALLLYNPSTWRQVVRNLVLKILLRTGLYRLVFREFFLVAKSRGVEEGILLQVFRDRMLNQEGGIALLNASQGSGTKAIAAPLSLRGQPEAYVKITNDEIRKGLMRNEARILQELKELDLRHAEVPRVVESGERGSYEYVVMSPAQETLESTGLRLTQLHVQFLAELFNKTRAEGKTIDCKPIAAIATRIEKFFQTDEKERTLLQSALREVVAGLGDRVQVGLAHRDFVSWNIKKKGGKLFVYDWEWAGESLPFVDLLHFVIHGEYHARGVPLLNIIRRFNDKTRLPDHFKSYAQRTQNNLKDLESSLLFYLLDRITFECELAGEHRVDAAYIQCLQDRLQFADQTTG